MISPERKARIMGRASGFLKELMVKDTTNFIQHVYFKIKLASWWKIYERIRDENGLTYICPYRGTGDVYVAAGFLASQIGADRVKEAKVCVIGGACKNVVKLFGFKDVEAVDQGTMDAIIRMGTVLGFSELDLFVLHPDPPNSKMGIADHLRNYNGFNFMDYFSAGVFQNRLLRFKKPDYPDCKEEVAAFFEENDLIPGKTVIVAPYVNTLEPLPVWMWIEVVDELRKKGFTVCTNCGEENWPIYGSLRISPPYYMMKDFCEYAGYFIGSRSGLCDIVSGYDLCKVIVYPSGEYWGSAGVVDFFSLNDMGLCDDAIELVHIGIDFLSTKDEILNHVLEWEATHSSEVAVDLVR